MINIYRDDEPESDSDMQFTLVYSGQLRPTQRAAEPHQAAKNPTHKHDIRRCFHAQLRELWQNHPVLSRYKETPTSYAALASGTRVKSWRADRFDQQKQYKLSELIQADHVSYNYEWVPLVKRMFSLACSLDIVLLRRDGLHSPLDNGDLDNRVKTLIDALKMPRSGNELVDEDERPREGEKPFFVLLEDDSLVSNLRVDTRELLYPRALIQKYPERQELRVADERMVCAIITVGLKPYDVNVGNLSFARHGGHAAPGSAGRYRD